MNNDASKYRKRHEPSDEDYRFAREWLEANESEDPRLSLPAHSLISEQLIIGTTLRTPSLLQEKSHERVTEWFLDLRHQTIYRAMQELGSDKLTIENLTETLLAKSQLEAIGGSTYLAALWSESAQYNRPEIVVRHLEILECCYQRRQAERTKQP